MHGDIIKFKINTINEAGGAAVAEKSVAENKKPGEQEKRDNEAESGERGRARNVTQCRNVSSRTL